MLIAFYIVAFLAVASALNVLILRSPVYCALSMVSTFFFLGVLFILLNNEFVAAIQILVYAGAIMAPSTSRASCPAPTALGRAIQGQSPAGEVGAGQDARDVLGAMGREQGAFQGMGWDAVGDQGRELAP